MSDFFPCDWCGWMPGAGCTCPPTYLDARRLADDALLRHAEAVQRARTPVKAPPPPGAWATADGLLAAHLWDEGEGRSRCGLVEDLRGRRLRDAGVQRCRICAEIAVMRRLVVARQGSAA